MPIFALRHGELLVLAARPSTLGDGECFDGLTFRKAEAVQRHLKMPALRHAWISPVHPADRSGGFLDLCRR